MDQTSRRPVRAAALFFGLMLEATAVGAATTTPLATPASPTPTGRATATAGLLVTVSPPAPTATPRASVRPTPRAASESETIPLPPADAAAPAAIATSLAARPRAFRTPERAAPPAFVAPPAASAPNAPNESEREAPAVGMLPPRASAAMVVFRATARTALEGFDLRVAYPRTLGTFAAHGEPECTAATGTVVLANDRGGGELHVVVASAQSLPLPLDVFCRFTVAGGARLDAGDFDVRVAEVTDADAKRGDPSLLLVTVAVR